MAYLSTWGWTAYYFYSSRNLLEDPKRKKCSDKLSQIKGSKDFSEKKNTYTLNLLKKAKKNLGKKLLFISEKRTWNEPFQLRK